MASRLADPSAYRRRRASPKGDKGKRPRGIQKDGPQKTRSSARLEDISRLRENENRKAGQPHSSLLTEENRPAPLPLQSQKRTREVADCTSTERPRKRHRSLPTGPCLGQTVGQEAASTISASQRSHIGHWAKQKTWPKEYFQQNSMHYLIARQKSTASHRRKQSESSLNTSVTPSDQKPREEKSAPYKKASYPTLLETLSGSYMDVSKLGISDASKVLCQNLLEKKYTTPNDTLFHDDVFQTACRNLRDKNEARIILDIARLLAPSPEALAAFGDKSLNILVESINEGWNNCIPVMNPRPQPDFSVGFGRSVFSDDQLSKLQPLLGDPSCLSYFRATYYMYFPFLTCEVKCGTTGLDIADRQNSHSMTLAVRGIVEYFKLVKREDELHRELLTFSISHDQRTVRLYGYYPIIDGSKTEIYRHPIHTFDITTLDGKERWTTYNFTVAVYNHSLTLLEKIRSVVDELPPDFNLEHSQLSEPRLSEHSGRSQQFENQISVQEPGEQDSESSRGDLQPITPDTSTQTASKKRKNKKRV
ncbi:hypothetical protein MMC11_006734 [Xylographa trunciseda]|nr:hypothetical protein [Xylographa trunciseda]